MSDSRRLKVNHITQGHPGNEQGNFDSNLGLTPGLCMRKTSILKRQRLQKAAKKMGHGEIRDQQEKGTAPRKEGDPGYASPKAGSEEQGRALLAQTALGLKSC